MPFQDLPVEVMRLILNHSLRRDFITLQRVSRSVHTLTEALLYEEITWAESSRNNDDFLLLLRTLLDRPQLGAHIKRINILGCLEDISWEPRTHNLGDSDLKRLANRGTTLKIGHWKHEKTWMDEFEEGGLDSFLILVLSYCTALQALLIGRGLELMTIPEIWPLTAPQGTISETTLKEVGYGLDSLDVARLPWIMPRINSIFLLPQLRTLRLQVTDVVGDPGQDASLLRSSSITTLELRDCSLREESVGYLVSRVPNLTSLRVGLTRDATPADEEFLDSFLDCSKLARSISKLSVVDSTHNTVTTGVAREVKLKNLAISIKFFMTTAVDLGNGGPWGDGRAGNEGWVRNWGIRGSMGSFRSFTALETLEIAPELLFGWHAKGAKPLRNIIPNSLRKLTLRCDLADWEEYEWNVDSISAVFLEYLEDDKHKGLKSVALWWMDRDYDDFYDESLVLKEKLRLRGVHMNIHRVDRFPKD